MFKFKITQMMKDAGIRGARNGRDTYNPKIYRYYSPKIEAVEREVIRNIKNSGSVIMKLDDENQGRIVWDFRYLSTALDDNTPEWENASIFVRDFAVTSYDIINIDEWERA